MTDSPRQATLLLVDDTPDNLAVLKDVLGRDYKLKAATNGELALKIAETGDPPDLILLDVMMPGMDGYEVCRRLRQEKRTADIPVIFVTARGDEADETLGFSCGAVDYIVKPISPPIVQSRVRAHLALRFARENLERQNEVLKDNDRLRDQVDRIMRHDLKSPLSAFLSIPNFLKGKKNLTPDQTEMLGMLEKSAYRMLDMINRSLDLYKIETGTYKLRPVPVDILKLITQASWDLGNLAQSKASKIEVFIGGLPPEPGQAFEILGEETLFYSMFANLAKNALEATPEGKAIVVELDLKPSPIISIHNHGAVPIEIRSRFMQKFVTCSKPGGTGLGGYSARLMAHTLGGEIRFESTEELGTRIFIEFPETLLPSHASSASMPAEIRPELIPGTVLPDETNAEPVSQPWVAEPPSPPPSGPNIRRFTVDSTVLIVDDNSLFRYALVPFLSAIGFKRILQAENGAKALKLLEAKETAHLHNLGLVICDWIMPSMNGLDLLREIRANPSLANLAFIMTTAEPSPKLITDAHQAGVTMILAKPFSLDTLREKIERLLA